MSQEEVKKKLKEDLDEANWDMLKPHYERESLIWVSQELNLVEVGAAIALDHTESVKKWMDHNKIHKANEEQVQSWEKDPSQKRFIFLILQPYVIIQEKLN